MVTDQRLSRRSMDVTSSTSRGLRSPHRYRAYVASRDRSTWRSPPADAKCHDPPLVLRASECMSPPATIWQLYDRDRLWLRLLISPSRPIIILLQWNSTIILHGLHRNKSADKRMDASQLSLSLNQTSLWYDFSFTSRLKMSKITLHFSFQINFSFSFS